jgi:predicted MPP superfamily phosphohydrolase
MPTDNDFSHLRQFPGESGNTFDVVLHEYEKVERIPAILFAGCLFVLAALPTRLNWPLTFGLWGFFLLDWLIIGLLPRFLRSFGPAHPPVLMLAALRAVFALLPIQLSIPLQVIGTLLVVYSFWIEPHWLAITYQSLETPKFSAGAKLRILHLGDLHLERITRREIAIQAEIDRLKPDLILFSGDILNLSYRNDPTAIEQARQVMSQWRAPLGVYLVSGSPAVDLAENMLRILDPLPIRWLQSDRITIPVGSESIDLVGLTCTHRPQIDGPILRELLPEPPVPFTILLYHSPDLAPIAAYLGVDLQLSGHTHGGQVRIPGFGALVTGSLYGKKFETGRIQLHNLTLYVTHGLGLEGAAAPRLRLFCRPEMILWEITGTPTRNSTRGIQ